MPRRIHISDGPMAGSRQGGLGCVCLGVVSARAPVPHLQQGPIVTLGALVALLLLPVQGVVDSGR